MTADVNDERCESDTNAVLLIGDSSFKCVPKAKSSNIKAQRLNNSSRAQAHVLLKVIIIISMSQTPQATFQTQNILYIIMHIEDIMNNTEHILRPYLKIKCDISLMTNKHFFS